MTVFHVVFKALLCRPPCSARLPPREQNFFASKIMQVLLFLETMLPDIRRFRSLTSLLNAPVPQDRSAIPPSLDPPADDTHMAELQPTPTTPPLYRSVLSTR
ncbi:hypothetical protein FA95DRAFT_564784 [Auriscalpium vulgare]|uniref:Uncharacterized protein n=1 Tax=Auriscalpium vulgare TaxID=40419 RepID=A0ACB8REW6_9AGAM|nr:hypothetical protein FA95DRAFT_564784 [Auriscalpium vulgare]